MALQTSISELQKEIYLDSEHRYHAKLPIIFMASSALNFATLEPDDLPSSNVAIDIYVIRNQDVILSSYRDGLAKSHFEIRIKLWKLPV